MKRCDGSDISNLHALMTSKMYIRSKESIDYGVVITKEFFDGVSV